MSIDEFNNLLEELTHEDLTTDRQLEIFSSLQSDKQKHIDDYNTLSDNTNKLQDDFNAMRKKKVDDFFHKGTEFTPEPTNGVIEEKKLPTYDEIVDSMIGGN